MSQDKTLLSIKDVSAVLTLSTTTIWRHVKAGTLPSPIKIGGSTRWRSADIEAIFAPADPE